MNFQNIEAFYQAGQKALAAFGLEHSHELRLLHRSENITFTVADKQSDGGGQIYGVLRVGRPGYHTTEELDAEIRWMRRICAERTVPIAVPMENQQAEFVTVVENGKQTYDCVMFEYLTGAAPNPYDRERGLGWFRQVGEIAALLHRQTMNWGDGGNLCRPRWDYEALLGEQALFGDWRRCRELGEAGVEVLTKACGVIRERLARYGTAPERFGLIHSDLRAANLLVEGHRMAVLDFDDCGYGWHLMDLAASISFVEDSPLAKQWIAAWIDGYKTYMPFDQRDQREIDTFVMIRRIQLLAWITSHDDSDPVEVYWQGYAKKTLEMAKHYLDTQGRMEWT